MFSIQTMRQVPVIQIILVSEPRVHESLWEFTGPNLIKWLKCTWKFKIFLPDRMNFYETCQAVRQSFVKTVGLKE